jgi:hypothetical protein
MMMSFQKSIFFIGVWKGWDLGLVPPHLIHLAQSFLLILKGAAPVHQQQRDNRGWGKTSYSVKGEDKDLQGDSHSLKNQICG